MSEPLDRRQRADRLLRTIERAATEAEKIEAIEFALESYADLCVSVECSMAERALVHTGRRR